jgi:uncharacterized protein
MRKTLSRHASCWTPAAAVRQNDRVAATIEDLLERATGGRSLDPRRMFSPSRARDVLEQPFKAWCDIHAPAEERVDTPSLYERRRIEHGRIFRERYVRRVYPDAVEIPPQTSETALRSTLEAMRAGARAIHNAALWWLPGGMYGRADLLIRQGHAPSDLGRWHYVVEQVTDAGTLHPHHAVECAAYELMLGHMQGRRSRRAWIVLRDGREAVDLAEARPLLEDVLAQWRRLLRRRTPPEWPRYAEGPSPWRVWADRALEQRRDPTVAPPITAHMREKLRKVLRVRTLDDLRKQSEERLKRALGPKIGARVYLRLQAYWSGAPIRIGPARLRIPRARRLLYWDYETAHDEATGAAQHVYLIGIHEADSGRYVAFLGRGPEDEERIVERFLDYAGDVRDARFYHWTDYEIRVTRWLMERHHRFRARLRRILEGCVDLKRIVEQHFAFPTRSMSLKEVAPWVGFRWREQGMNGKDAMVLYWDWLKTGDADLERRILEYNEDDCRALREVDRWLCGGEIRAASAPGAKCLTRPGAPIY